MAMAAVSRKRKRAVLTIGTKLEIVLALEMGSSQRVVGEKFRVAKATIAHIWKDHKKISDSVSASESPALAKKCIVPMPHLTWWMKPVGNGFISSARRELLSLGCCCKKKRARSSQSFILMLIRRASRAAQDG